MSRIRKKETRLYCNVWRYCQQ